MKEHTIFLIDAIGAFISIAFLVSLYVFSDFVGVQKSVLIKFVLIAIVLSIYSSTVYLLKPTSWKIYLRILASLNFAYCLFTGIKVFQASDTITVFGYIYFVTEIIIILGLATYEVALSRKSISH